MVATSTKPDIEMANLDFDQHPHPIEIFELRQHWCCMLVFYKFRSNVIDLNVLCLINACINFTCISLDNVIWIIYEE